VADETKLNIKTEGPFPSDLRHALMRRAVEIQMAIEAFERDGEPYSLKVEIVLGGSSTGFSPVDTIEAALQTSLDVAAKGEMSGQVQSLAEISATVVRSQGESGLILQLRGLSALRPDPMGTLLADELVPDSRDNATNTIVSENIRRALEPHVMGRPDAEYAAVIDLSRIGAGADRLSMMSNYLLLLRDFASALPAETAGRPKLYEYHVRVPVTHEGDERRLRVRVWRLGIMKIASDSRVV
jgi:hypothetical protein